MSYSHVFRKFAQGDKVSYNGQKLASELSGKLGIVEAYVQNKDDGFSDIQHNSGTLVVSFDGDAFVVAESNIRYFQGHLRQERQDNKEETKNPDIQKRKGGKRKPEDQEAT